MKPVAKRGDRISGTAVHVQIRNPAPPPAGPTPPEPVRQDYGATFGTDLSPDVLAERRNVATVGSKATMRPGLMLVPPAIYAPPGVGQPSNGSEVIMGSTTVYVNHKQIARDTDLCSIGGKPINTPTGRVEARGTVYAD